MNMPINAAGERLLKSSEGLVLHAYPDPRSPLGVALQRARLWRQYLRAPIPRSKMPADIRELDGAPWTIGYGDTLDVHEGDSITRDEAESRLALRMERDFLSPMRAAFKVEPGANQLGAMACLAWNIGIGAFLKSTVLKCHNRGDFAAAARAFGLFNKSRGKEDSVLVARRAEEAALYLQPDYAAEPLSVPQTVDAESSMARSPIVTGTSVATGTATLGMVAEGARSAKDIRESLGDWLPWILIAVAMGAAGYVIWTRVLQRRGGWA